MKMNLKENNMFEIFLLLFVYYLVVIENINYYL